MLSFGAGVALIVAAGLLGLLFAAVQLYLVAQIDLGEEKKQGMASADYTAVPDSKEGEGGSKKVFSQHQLMEVYSAVREGAQAFLVAEYKVCVVFIVLFGALVLVLVSSTKTEAGNWDWARGALTCASFVVGAVTSIVSGYIGMSVAVFSNARTTKAAMVTNDADAWKNAFNTAFRAGGVMGFSLCGLALLVLFAIIELFKLNYGIKTMASARMLFECVAGFGLGGSSIAMFGRVGGGIYTKAADVGADLAGKVCNGLDEDDPRNPACIADNVGDNVGDVAGMGSDLFGSFGEATCAALVIASQSPELVAQGMSALLFPLYISAVGIFACFLTSFLATNIRPVRAESGVEFALKIQIFASTALTTVALIPVCHGFLPEKAHFGCSLGETFDAIPVASEAYPFNNFTNAPLNSCTKTVSDTLPWYSFACVAAGLWGGCLIGFITEYYTSASYSPVQEVADSTKTGAATNIIYGLALGYKSAVAPAIIISAIIFGAFSLLGMFGISLSALGMLSTLATCLSIDVYGPVCDNAGGIAEMSHCRAEVRKKTDALDAAGNTTAAIGKGFAIGSAALVSLALFGAFVTTCGSAMSAGVNMLWPITFAFLLFGAMLPYWFSAMTMKSVGTAAMAMVKEVEHQFETRHLLEPPWDIAKLQEEINKLNMPLNANHPETFTPEQVSRLADAGWPQKPDHAKCIAISTDASLKEMIAPGAMVMLTPILTGTLFGVEAVTGLLAGALVSSVQLAISASNTGGAWDNAKKFVEGGNLKVKGVVQKKNSDCHKAAVVGDTVGDPLKDTSGPALNIVMKLMAIISLVFANFFLTIHDGQGAFQVASWAVHARAMGI